MCPAAYRSGTQLTFTTHKLIRIEGITVKNFLQRYLSRKVMIYLAAGLRDNGAGTLLGSELIEKKATTARKNLVSAGREGLAGIRTHISGPEQLSAPEIPPDCEIL